MKASIWEGEMRCVTCAAVTACLLLAGCQTTQWVKPGATASDFEADKRQCVYESNLATPGTPSYDVGSAIAAGINDGMRLGQLQTMCMQARGWNLIAVDATPPPPPPAPAVAMTPAASAAATGPPVSLSPR
jgi:hypothetical protein